MKKELDGAKRETRIGCVVITLLIVVFAVLMYLGDKIL